MDFDNKYNIVDKKIPRHCLMTARYKQSFAYYTLRERLPVILTQVIDNLSKDKDSIADEYTEAAREELKEIVGNISKLKYELQTDKKIIEINSNEPDKDIWNTFIQSLQSDNNTFFSTCWLYAECYMYRKLKSFFESVTILKNYDYFQKQKQIALISQIDVLEMVIKKTSQLALNPNPTNNNQYEYFQKLLKLNLWGNRCDLSITEGKEIQQSGDQFTAIDTLDKYILIDNTSNIWKCLKKKYHDERIIDIVNDNSGYELFTDFLIADYLIEHNLATKIRFYVKTIPWFISDVTPTDFQWTIDYLKDHPSSILSQIGNKWYNYLKDGQFILMPSYDFWTSPYEFYRMNEIAHELYMKLSEAHLIIFKGDLNYRKLLGDFTWDFTEDFRKCLRGFNPTNLCTLRTVKADLICGLEEGVADKLYEYDPKWMTTGQYGVIQYSSRY